MILTFGTVVRNHLKKTKNRCWLEPNENFKWLYYILPIFNTFGGHRSFPFVRRLITLFWLLSISDPGFKCQGGSPTYMLCRPCDKVPLIIIYIHRYRFRSQSCTRQFWGESESDVCIAKCLAYYNVGIWFIVWIGIRIWIRQCKETMSAAPADLLRPA